MAFIVTAPLVITKKQDGSDLYLYENAPLPSWVTDSEAKRLSDMRLVKEVGEKTPSKAPTAQSN